MQRVWECRSGFVGPETTAPRLFVLSPVQRQRACRAINGEDGEVRALMASMVLLILFVSGTVSVVLGLYLFGIIGGK